MEYLKELLSHIPEHLLAAIILWLFGTCVQRFRYWYNLIRLYNNRTFDVFYKGDEKKRIRQLLITVEKNKLVFKGTTTTGNPDGDFSGEIILNLFNLRIGEGYLYHHNFNGFNFPKVVIKDSDTFLVETSFLIPKQKDGNTIFEKNYQAFVWKRLPKK